MDLYCNTPRLQGLLKILEVCALTPKPLNNEILKTLKVCALEKGVMGHQEKLFILRDHHSTELSQDSWLKEVILLTATEEVVNLSSEQNSSMRTSLTGTPAEEFCQWQMPVLTPTAHNFSSASTRHLISTKNMSSSAVSRKAIKHLQQLNLLVAEVDRHQSQL